MAAAAFNATLNPFPTVGLTTLSAIVMTSTDMTETMTNDSTGNNATTTMDPIEAQKAAEIDRYLQQSACSGALFEFEKFTYYMLGVAALMILAFCFLKVRRNKRELCLNSRPGLCYPVRLNEESQERFAYVAAFAVTGWSIYLISVNNLSYSWTEYVPTEAKGLVKLFNCIVIGFLYYPIFAGISSNHWIGYILGELYTLAMVVGFVLTMIPCDIGETGLLIVEVLRFLPIAIFYAFICLYFIYLLVKLFRNRKTEAAQPAFEMDKSTRVYKRVKTLLKKSLDDYNPFEAFRKGGEAEFYGKQSRGQALHPQNPPTKMELARLKAKELAVKKIFAHSDDFKYSTNILTAVGLSLLVMYIILLSAIKMQLKGEWALRRLQEIDTIGQLAQGNLPGPLVAVARYLDPNGTQSIAAVTEQYAGDLIFWQASIRGIYYFSVLLSFLLCVLLVLDILRKYKRDLLLMQRGIYEYIPRWSNQGPVSIVRNAIKFTGYQAGFAASGLVLMMVLMGAIVLAVYVLAAVIFRYKKYELLIRLLQMLWPLALVFVLIYVSQYLLIRFCFLLKNRNGNLILALDNRHFFFNVQFFMVFINAAMGLLSSLITIVKSAFFGIWTLPRLDMSAFPRSFESFDPGFTSYCSMLKLDHVQRNPVVQVFTSLMLNGVRKRQLLALQHGSGAQKYIDRKLRHERLRNKWALAVTLANNPGLGLYRKLDELPNSNINNGLIVVAPCCPKEGGKSVLKIDIS